jgi:hypothetical protein
MKNNYDSVAFFLGTSLHSRPEILQAFREAKHTETSSAILEGIESETLKIVFHKRLRNAGSATGKTITVNRTMNLDDILATLVHEGRHHLDIVSGLIPLPNQASTAQRLLAESRAFSHAAEFAKLNNLTMASAFIHSQLHPAQLLESIIATPAYRFGQISDDLFREILEEVWE